MVLGLGKAGERMTYQPVPPPEWSTVTYVYPEQELWDEIVKGLVCQGKSARVATRIANEVLAERRKAFGHA